MTRFPFTISAENYSFKESCALTLEQELSGGFSDSVLDFDDAAWLVSFQFFLKDTAKYNEFINWYDEYIAPKIPEPFDIELFIEGTADYSAYIIPDSINVQRVGYDSYMVSMSVEAFENTPWFYIVGSPWFLDFEFETISVSMNMLDGEYSEVHYTTETYDNYAPETVSVSFAMLDGVYDQIGYTTETYDNYAEESVEVTFAMLDGEYSQIEYTTETYDNYAPETVSVSFSMLNGDYSQVSYTTRTYNNYAEETVSVSFAMLNGEYQEITI